MRKPLQALLLSLSGVGKSTCVNILEHTGEFERGVTCTTRPRRPGEVNGIDYDFLTTLQYWWYVLTGRMKERSSNYGIYYGILKHRIDRAHATDKPTLWVLNVPGLTWMRREFGADNVLPILLWAPPHVLRERMQGRGDKQEDTERRLSAAPQEVSSALDHGAIQIDTTHLTPEEVARAVRAQVEWWYVNQK